MSEILEIGIDFGSFSAKVSYKEPNKPIKILENQF